MSSTLKIFEGDFLKNPMCIEFSSWIKNSIKWRLEKKWDMVMYRKP